MVDPTVVVLSTETSEEKKALEKLFEFLPQHLIYECE